MVRVVGCGGGEFPARISSTRAVKTGGGWQLYDAYVFPSSTARFDLLILHFVQCSAYLHCFLPWGFSVAGGGGLTHNATLCRRSAPAQNQRAVAQPSRPSSARSRSSDRGTSRRMHTDSNPASSVDPVCGGRHARPRRGKGWWDFEQLSMPHLYSLSAKAHGWWWTFGVCS